MKDYAEIERLKDSANSAKDRLIEIAWKLEDQGARREARSLCTIIEKLELWQNK